MDKTLTTESTFEEIGNVVQIKLMKEFMESRMDVDAYRILSRGMNALFGSLHADQSDSGISSEQKKTNHAAAAIYTERKEKIGGFVNAMA